MSNKNSLIENPNFSKEFLEKKYWQENWSHGDLAKYFNVTPGAIRYWFIKYNIQRRNDKIAVRLAISGNKNPAKRPEVRKKLSGKNNHFYGKRHSLDAKNQMSIKQKLWDRSQWIEIRWTNERKKEFSKNNPMFNQKHREKQKIRINEEKHKFSGPNSPRWKGGITKLNDQIRQTNEYKKWRKAVFEQNEYTCVFCGNKNMKLNADHIIPFSIIIETHNIINLQKAYSCKELWDVSNGRTLCVKCHKKTDTYGSKLISYKKKEQK